VVQNVRGDDLSPSDLHKLNMKKEYDEVLALTAHSNGSNGHTAQELAPGRAMALVCLGNKSAGIRLVRSSILAGSKDPYLFRSVIGCARRARNVSLVREYLLLDIPPKKRREFCKFLTPCLEFITSPQLIAEILAEVVQYGNSDLVKVLETTSAKFESEIMGRSVALNLCCMLDAKNLPLERIDAVAAFLAKHDSRVLADTWAQTGGITEP